MKIFITNILPSSLKNKLTKMQVFEVKSFNKTEIASEDYGLHVIENNKQLSVIMGKMSERFKDHPHVAEVRQTGMILAIEMVKNKRTRIALCLVQRSDWGQFTRFRMPQFFLVKLLACKKFFTMRPRHANATQQF